MKIEEEEEDTGPKNPENYVNQIEDDEEGVVFGIDNKRFFKEDWEKVPEWDEVCYGMEKCSINEKIFTRDIVYSSRSNGLLNT